MNCLVVDDDALSRKIICDYVGKSGVLSLVAECENTEEAAKVLENNYVDLLLLDVEMPGMTGIEFISTLTSRPKIILITSNSEYAAGAFNLDVTDYLLKPTSFDRFMKAIKKAQETSTVDDTDKKELTSFFVKHNSKLVKVEIDSVEYIESLGDYISIFTNEGNRYVVYSTMKQAENRLPSDKFCRIHRSHIVNLNKISGIEDDLIKVGDKNFNIGKSYKKELLSKIELF